MSAVLTAAAAEANSTTAGQSDCGYLSELEEDLKTLALPTSAVDDLSFACSLRR